MTRISLADYLKIHTDFRGIWTTERDDWKGWPEVREQYMGKRTMMAQDGSCSLLVEGMGLEIIES